MTFDSSNPVSPEPDDFDSNQAKREHLLTSDNATRPMSFTRLSQPDADALDALIEAQFSLNAVPEKDRLRAARIKALLGLLDEYPRSIVGIDAPTDDGLCYRTMLYVRRHRRRGQERQGDALTELIPVPAEPSRRWVDQTSLRFPSFRISLRDVVGLAASVVLLIGIFGPTLANARSHAIRQSCRGNMSGIAVGLDAYASDYQDSLPIAHQVMDGNDWFHSLANSANLFLVAHSGYASLETLACPGNGCAIRDNAFAQEHHNWPDLATSSFSFQNLLGNASRPLWRLRQAVPLLSDRNPFEVALWQDAPPCAVNSNAQCHGPDGQNILMSSGCVMWKTDPVINGDNIWLPQGLPVPKCGTVRLQGNELPSHSGDVMLIQ